MKRALLLLLLAVGCGKDEKIVKAHAAGFNQGWEAAIENFELSHERPHYGHPWADARCAKATEYSNTDMWPGDLSDKNCRTMIDGVWTPVRCAPTPTPELHCRVLISEPKPPTTVIAPDGTEWVLPRLAHRYWTQVPCSQLGGFKP